jgi:SOS-response transcriptional repressor LexA
MIKKYRPLNLDFSERLKSLWKSKGLGNNNQFAKAIKKRASTTNNWAMGRIPSKLEDWKIICDFFGVTTDYLLLGKEIDIKKSEIDLLKYHKIIWTSNLEKIPKASPDDFIPVPLVSGRIAAGSPVLPDESIEDIALIHVSQVGRGRDLVAVRIREGAGEIGKSMSPILGPGDIVAIDRNDKTEIKKKAIYAIRVKMDDRFGCTLKYVERPQTGFLILRPENKETEIEIMNLNENPDPIIGRVIWAWRTLREK